MNLRTMLKWHKETDGEEAGVDMSLWRTFLEADTSYGLPMLPDAECLKTKDGLIDCIA